jgi:hypothetical protein
MWKIIILLVISLTTGCVLQDTTGKGKVMTNEQALHLVQCWATHAHEGLESLAVEQDGSFYGQLGAPYVEFCHEQQNLVIRGLVYAEGDKVLKVPNLWSHIKRAETEEKKTLAGGFFEIDLNAMAHGKQPGLNLRRDFKDGTMGSKEFIKAVDDLMTAATWWRKQRFYQLLITTP